MNILLRVIVLVWVPAICVAQSKHPHVNDIVKEFDKDGDGMLTKQEVAKNKRYANQFPRWDTDKDGLVSAADITTMRAKFGIAADGTMAQLPRERPGSPTGNTKKLSMTLSIPDVSDLVRVGPGKRPDPALISNSEFVIATAEHAVSGTAYLVVTDHIEAEYLDPLRRLVEHRNGTLLVFEDLANIHSDTAVMSKLSVEIKSSKPKFVAVAPRLDSFSENTVLGILAVLSGLDADMELDCYPGFLIASNAKSFSRLIDQTIAHKPISPAKLKPFAISQVQDARETRSLQKSGILRKHFKQAGLETPIVAIYGQTADAAPRLPGDKVWNLKVEGRKRFVKEFPADAQAALDSANLIVMHGHGIPGMSCSVDVDGLPGDCAGKVLLSGSCFSACPSRSDLPKMNRAPGGYDVEQRDAFVLRAIDITSGGRVIF